MAFFGSIYGIIGGSILLPVGFEIVFFSFFLFFPFFGFSETGFLCVALAVLELTL
jgi:hypothetical protein